MKRAPVCLLLFFFLLPFTIAAQIVPNLTPKPRPDGPYPIRGKVVNGQTGQPIGGAEIRIYENAQNIGDMFELVESAGDGSFHFDGLAAGKYTLRASRRGYAPQAYLQHENYWTGIALGPGKDAQHLRFALYPSAMVNGRVTDENGEGIRQAEIKLWNESLQNGEKKGTVESQTSTDDQGRYQFDHLAGGKYTVSVMTYPWYRRFLNAEQTGAGESLDGAEAAEADGEFVSTPPPVTAVPNPKLESKQENSLLDLVYPIAFYPTGRTLREASWFQLRPGDEHTADFQLNATPGLHVLVRTGQTEETLPSVVRFLPATRELGMANVGTVARPIALGLVEISGLTPGSYRVQVMNPGGAGVHEEEVEINGDEQLDLRRGSSSGAAISGTLGFARPPTSNTWVILQAQDAAGHKTQAQSAPAQVANSDAGNARETAPSEYTFRFDDLAAGAGVYELSAISPPGAIIEKMEATGAQVKGTKVTIDGTNEVHLNVTIAEISTAVQGTATKKGEPFAGAMILLLPERGQPELVRRDQSDSDGTFTLPNVVPGKYWLMALENGWDLPWADPEQQKALLGKAIAAVIGGDAPKPFKIEVE